MSPKAVVYIVLAVLVLAGAVLWLVVWSLRRQAGVRRAEFARVRRDRDLLARAVAEIEERTEGVRDIDSVLAPEVRQILRTLTADRLENTR